MPTQSLRPTPYRRHTRKPRQRIPPRNDSDRFPYRSRKTLLTPCELRFFKEGLLPAVGREYSISAKVRLADVITCKRDLWAKPPGRRIQQKHLDFVLTCPKTSRIIAAVELNDASHEKRRRRARDAFLVEALAAARIPLVTVPAARRYDPDAVDRQVYAALKRCEQGCFPPK